LGIGTSSPAKGIEARGGARIAESTGAVLDITPSTTGTNGVELKSTYYADGYGPITFNTGNTANRVVIDASGNVGIGTGSPSGKLEIANYDQTNGATLSLTNSFVGSSWSSGDVIGAVDFRTDDTSTTEPVRGRIKVFDDATVSGTYAAYGAMSFSTATINSLIERMRITSSGNLLLNTASHTPTNTELVVSSEYNASGTTDAGITLSARQSGNWRNSGIFANGDALTFTTGDTGLNGAISTSEKMRIDSSGNLLVGTTTSAGGGKITVDVAGVSGTLMSFQNSQNLGGSITVISGGGTAYNTSSDYRLKTDAQPMTGASARVQALNPVNFEWIANGTRVDGFLAHEAQEVVPEAVTGTKDAMRDEEYEVTPAVLDDDGNVVTEAVMGTRSVPDYQGIDQSKLVPLLTAALQEALTKIDALETRITALEG
jgi:hypothetical protein